MSEIGAALRTGLDQALASAPRVRLAVVGDVILDQFLYGTVERISPEAPVPVVEVERELFRLGGAANVVHNLRALGASVDLVGVVGIDPEAQRLRSALEALGLSCEGLVELSDRSTAVKTRVIAQHQQVVRFDRERKAPLPAAAVDRMTARLIEQMPELAAVIVSDYGKGVVTHALMTSLLRAARAHGVYVAVDPKPHNAGCYRGVDVITPNTKEAESMTGLPARSDEEVARAGWELLARHEAGAILVTRGDRGMTLVEKGGDVNHIATRARDVFDVTGAGDTTVSVLTLARACGAAIREAACLANLAAGIVVGKLGTAVVTLEELRDAAENGIRPGAGTFGP